VLRWFGIAAVLVGAFVLASSAFAGYGHENEFLNPCFIQGGTDWEASPNVLFNAGGELKFGRPHIAYDPMGQGESAYLRQIVDYSPHIGWNPDLNRKIGTLSFLLYTTGTAYLKVGFDWWDRLTGPKPVGAGQYYEILDTEFRSVDEWTRIEVDYDWLGKPGNNQPTRVPRSISPEPSKTKAW